METLTHYCPRELLFGAYRENPQGKGWATSISTNTLAHMQNGSMWTLGSQWDASSISRDLAWRVAHKQVVIVLKAPHNFNPCHSTKSHMIWSKVRTDLRSVSRVQPIHSLKAMCYLRVSRMQDVILGTTLKPVPDREVIAKTMTDVWDHDCDDEDEVPIMCSKGDFGEDYPYAPVRIIPKRMRMLWWCNSCHKHVSD